MNKIFAKALSRQQVEPERQLATEHAFLHVTRIKNCEIS